MAGSMVPWWVHPPLSLSEGAAVLAAAVGTAGTGPYMVSQYTSADGPGELVIHVLYNGRVTHHLLKSPLQAPGDVPRGEDDGNTSRPDDPSPQPNWLINGKQLPQLAECSTLAEVVAALREKTTEWPAPLSLRVDPEDSPNHTKVNGVCNSRRIKVLTQCLSQRTQSELAYPWLTTAYPSAIGLFATATAVDPEPNLASHPWFHDRVMSGDKAARVLALTQNLNNTGTFLVCRAGANYADYAAIMTVAYKGRSTHHLLTWHAGAVQFNGDPTPAGARCTSISALVKHLSWPHDNFPVVLSGWVTQEHADAAEEMDQQQRQAKADKLQAQADSPQVSEVEIFDSKENACNTSNDSYSSGVSHETADVPRSEVQYVTDEAQAPAESDTQKSEARSTGGRRNPVRALFSRFSSGSSQRSRTKADADTHMVANPLFDKFGF